MKRWSGPARGTRVVTAIAAAAGIAAAGIASAAWTANGAGNAKAQGGRLESVTASPATPSNELYPGGSADAALTLTNPNPVAMTIASIAGNGPITSSSAACDSAGHGVTFVDQAGAWEVAKNASLAVSIPNAVRMSVDSADACQGATFTIPVTVVASVSGQGGSGATTTTTAPAQVAWSQQTYSFPHTDVGAQSAPQTLTLRNVGGSSGTVQMGAVGSPEFQVVSMTCTNAVLAPGEACTVTVVFKPTQPGTRNSNALARITPQTNYVSTFLAGAASEPTTVGALGGTRDFGQVPVNTDSSQFFVEMRNFGNSPATNVQFAVVGTDASSFRIGTNNCPSMLSPGQACTISLIFRPRVTGPHSASLRPTWTNPSGTTGSSQTNFVGTGV